MTTVPFMKCDTDETAISGLPHPPVLVRAGETEAAQQAVRRWFPRDVEPTTGNSVVAYAYGKCAFADIGAALATATQPDHRIYLIGWGTDVDTSLRPGATPETLRGLLRSAKGQIRALFWANPEDPPDPEAGSSADAHAFINALPHGASVLDDKLPQLQVYGPVRSKLGGGIHHQKLVVVYGSQGLIAFTGGMDLNSSRLYEGPGKVNSPLHDVHVRVAGPAAYQLLRVFSDRWLDLPAAQDLDLRKLKMLRQQVQADFERINTAYPKITRTIPTCTGWTRNASMAVAVGRTFAYLDRHTAPKRTYAFAPYGDDTAWQLVKAAVEGAREHLYIEDQYLVSTRLRKLLAAKLAEPQFKFLLILACPTRVFEPSPVLVAYRPDGTPYVPNEFPYSIGARNDYRAAFSAIDPGRTRWRIFHLTAARDEERKKACGAYLHSKLIIADDEYVVTGSANADDRGYTYDSEIMVGLTDDVTGRADGQRFARDLRVSLWHKHLGLPHAQLADWPAGLAFWRKPPASAMVVDASDLEDSPMLGGKKLLSADPGALEKWQKFIDPDGFAP
ncbi:MAG: hypothetical protein HOV83_15300 [Catenulispora sp.]|nr:hypothetical protein [Catenulispora sp.]